MEDFSTVSGTAGVPTLIKIRKEPRLKREDFTI
jgi:hypothetical protein